jgi:hypothetical protein
MGRPKFEGAYLDQPSEHPNFFNTLSINHFAIIWSSMGDCAGSWLWPIRKWPSSGTKIHLSATSQHHMNNAQSRFESFDIRDMKASWIEGRIRYTVSYRNVSPAHDEWDEVICSDRRFSVSLLEKPFMTPRILCNDKHDHVIAIGLSYLWRGVNFSRDNFNFAFRIRVFLSGL